MPQKSVMLTFPRDLVDKPMVSRAIREHDVEVNIVQAFITPDEDGHIFAIVSSGDGKAIKGALAFLRGQGVHVSLPTHNLAFDDERCVHCGACVGQCPSDAFTIDAASGRISFHDDRCIACDLCIPACGFGALASVSSGPRRGVAGGK